METQLNVPRTFVVVGGGIGGVCCVEELQRVCSPGDTIILVSASSILKGVGPITRLTRNLEEFDIVEKSLESLTAPNTRVVCVRVTRIDTELHQVELHTGEVLTYTALCIATGARPKELSPAPCVFTVRDTDSVDTLARALSSPGVRRVVVVGNGGIALELVGLLQGLSGGLEVVWVMKHGHLGDSFFDTDAAQFLLQHTRAERAAQPAAQPRPPMTSPQLAQHVNPSTNHSQPSRSHQPQQLEGSTSSEHQVEPTAGAPAHGHAGAMQGHGAGPAWTRLLATRMEARHAAGAGEHEAAADGCGEAATTQARCTQSTHATRAPNRLVCEFSAQVVTISGHGTTTSVSSAAGEAQALSPTEIPPIGAAEAHTDDSSWPAHAQLSNGRVWGCDVVVAAVGVQPATEWLPPTLARAPDGGVLVDGSLRCVSVPDGSVYTIGDSCTLVPGCCGPHYFQMRLWTQARAHGLHAARVMSGVAEEQYYGGTGVGMELFAHATHFLGFKVVLLGLYNGQGLEDEAGGDVRMLSRVLHGPHCPHSQAGTSSGSDGGGSGDGSTGTGTTGGGSTGDGSTGDGVQGPPAEAAAELEGRQGGLGAAHRNKSGGEDTAGGGGGGRPAAEGCSFVRILLLRGKLVGAALIGDTDLEEVFENLIQDQLDLSHCAHELLDPDVELDHVFD